jgi:hypothetical protein
MPSAWDVEPEEERWSDREAWRGEEYPENSDAWRQDGDQGFVWAGDEGEAPGQDNAAGWPEDLAGPEYWMYRDNEET